MSITTFKQLSTRKFSPSLDEFRAKAREGNLIPVLTEVLADTETPVSAFYKVAYGRDYGFLLESVEGGEQLARYSFLGSDPLLVFRSEGDSATIQKRGGETETVPLQRRCHQRLFGNFQVQPVSLPRVVDRKIRRRLQAQVRQLVGGSIGEDHAALHRLSQGSNAAEPRRA